MKVQQIFSLAFLATVLLGCASSPTRYSNLTVDDRNEMVAIFLRGDAELACSGNWANAVASGKAVDRQHEFFASGQWSKLAVDVMSIGMGGNKNWFYLGRAAEGLGYPDAAETYYEKSLSGQSNCRCLGGVCAGLKFPKDTQARLAAIHAAKLDWKNLSAYERERKSELDFQAHVSFYQCSRWAKGIASEEMRAFMAALAAGAVSGVMTGQMTGTGSVAENAAIGASIGITADTTSRVYQSIRFPDLETKGKDFAYLFDECMADNGLYADGDRRHLNSWKFSDTATLSLVGQRGTFQVSKTVDADHCNMEVQFFNGHSTIANPTIELTLFDSGQNSLSEYSISFPSVFPDKSHVAELGVPPEECESTAMAFVSQAIDKVSGQEITEVARKMIPVVENSRKDASQ